MGLDGGDDGARGGRGLRVVDALGDALDHLVREVGRVLFEGVDEGLPCGP